MKSANKQYVIWSVVIVLCFVFFFTTKLWMGDDRTMRNTNYDELFTAGDWSLHVGKAYYDKAGNTLTCSVYQRAVRVSPKPYHIAVYLGRMSLNKKLQYTLEKRMDDPNMRTLRIKNVPTNYYYLTLEFTAQSSIMDEFNNISSTDNSTYEDDNEDFGNTNTVQKQEPDVKDIQIDYRTAKTAKLSSESSFAGRKG